MNKNVFLSLLFVLLVTVFSGQASAKEKLPAQGLRVQALNEQLITLNYRDMDIRHAFSALAMEFKLNIVMSNDVQGNITLHLFKLTIEDVLKTIAMAGGYDYKKTQGLYKIYKASPEEKIEVPKPIETQMKVFKTSFAEVGKVKATLSAVPGLNPIEIHESTKTIIVNDTLDNIKKIEKILSFLDAVPKQVLIEAKILKVALTDDMTFGVDWKAIMTDGIIQTSGLSTAVLPVPDKTTVVDGVTTITEGSTSPVGKSGKGMFGYLFAGVGGTSQIAVAIDALKSKAKVDTVATPKVLAIHGIAAKVVVGGKQGYRVTTTTDGVSTETIEFIDTGTILEITPYIDEHDNILLNVKPAISSATISSGIPVVTSTSVSTWLLAKDGETAFIAGLIETTDIKTKESIPILGDIPILSYVFSRTVDKKVKEELVILITPKIVRNNLSPSSKP
jgi:type II secretory pathway component GspD/PulD (secretin)